MKKLLGILVLGLLFIFVSNSPEAKAEDFKLTKITENLKSPWSLSFINQNEALITEKSGNIFYIDIQKQELKNYEKAIDSYKEVQKIYPSMQAPKVMIPRLKELIKDQSI